MANRQVRIIAGQWRGRTISFSEAEGLRPTGDRIRETLFNWLAPILPDRTCLDLFAGSGALGLEALSRNAKQVSFVDTNIDCIKDIEASLKTFGCESASLHRQTAEQFVNTQNLDIFDIIFIDPPYAQFELVDIASKIECQFSPETTCLVFYEHEKELQADELPGNWKINKQKKAGRVHYYLIQRQSINL